MDAQVIPEMGGRRIGKFLFDWAKQAPQYSAIVELGAWLGAGTSQMAAGLESREKNHGVKIYTFDNFKISESSVEKAFRQGVIFHPGEDSLPWVKDALSQYEYLIEYRKGMLTNENINWPRHLPISLYVDDATKYPYNFTLCLKKFGPSFIARETIVVLMDALIYLKKKNLTPAKLADLSFQHKFILDRPESFSKIRGFSDSSVAAYKYEGGVDFDALKMPLSPNERRALKTSRIWA
jgi:hypothetical protein